MVDSSLNYIVQVITLNCNQHPSEGNWWLTAHSTNFTITTISSADMHFNDSLTYLLLHLRITSVRIVKRFYIDCHWFIPFQFVSSLLKLISISKKPPFKVRGFHSLTKWLNASHFNRETIYKGNTIFTQFPALPFTSSPQQQISSRQISCNARRLKKAPRRPWVMMSIKKDCGDR